MSTYRAVKMSKRTKHNREKTRQAAEIWFAKHGGPGFKSLTRQAQKEHLGF
jgi:hypothetical protein